MRNRKASAWRPRANTIVNSKVRDEAMMNRGWIVGILSAVAVLNDDEEFNFTNEKLQRFIIDCDTLMYSIAHSMDDWRQIMDALEKRTGVKLTLRDGERPKDGRFAIVDEGTPEPDEYETED